MMTSGIQAAAVETGEADVYSIWAILGGGLRAFVLFNELQNVPGCRSTECTPLDGQHRPAEAASHLLAQQDGDSLTSLIL